jgi:hypothetical protein
MSNRAQLAHPRGHQRGEYGAPRVGAASPAAPTPTPWWKLAIGASLLLGAGYVLFRASTAVTDWPERSVPKIREEARAAGIKPWMTQPEMMRRWNAHNAKHGRPSATQQ